MASVLLPYDWILAFLKNHVYNSSMQLLTEHLLCVRRHYKPGKGTSAWHTLSGSLKDFKRAVFHLVNHPYQVAQETEFFPLCRKLNSHRSTPGPGRWKQSESAVVRYAFCVAPLSLGNCLQKQHFIWLLIGIRLRLNSGGHSLCLLSTF